MIVVHVTHEAVEKIGGIGAVIAGLMTTDAYTENVSRTILLGPLLQTDRPVNRRLGEGGKVIYSSLDSIRPPQWREKFQPIERTYDVGIIYGTRDVTDPYSGRSTEAEVLLVDVFRFNKDRLNLFKAELFKKFQIPSDRFESAWEFEEYVRLAEPGYEALKAIGCNGNSENREEVVYLAHEYMGMPTALKTVLAGLQNTRTVFYAHEVASVRPIVEKRPGHDTMFYNVMCSATASGMTLEEVFPEVLENFKHPLVKAARHCDHIFAVGNFVEDELQFVDPHFKTMGIDRLYNGIPALPLTLEEKQASRGRMKQYAKNLFGFEPTWIFTHVARPVPSKGLWRDLRVMEHLEPMLAERGETAVYFMLGTLAGQRRPRDIHHMEQVYGWPVKHEKGYPDLCQGEEHLGDMCAYFNKDHAAQKCVFVNQWDWNRAVCGDRMPEEMTFGDIRRGTDLEFGLSIYEPFGISQFEGLSFGALCVVSNICGCVGFAKQVAEGSLADNNIIEGDFLEAPDMTIEQLKDLSAEQRDAIENVEAQRLAEQIIEMLPRDNAAMQQCIDIGHAVAQRMSWEHVVTKLFLPSLGRTLEHR